MSASRKLRGGPLVRLLAMAATSFAAAAFATNLPPASVSFLDGSFLRGEIETLNSETLKWRHPNARQPIEFTTTSLNLIRLPTRSATLPTNAGPVCRVQLASGDEFEGHLLSLDGETFEVETWFAGRLRGQRTGLASLSFYGSSQSVLYDGPRVAEEWKVSNGAMVINRIGGDFLGGNLLVRPAVPVAPAPVAVPNPQELIAKLKDQLEKLGDKTPAVVKQALEKALKDAEALAPKMDGKNAVAPQRIVAPAAAAIPPPRLPLRLPLPARDNIPRPPNVAPNAIAPPAALQVDTVVQAVQKEIQRVIDGVRPAPQQVPPPPAALSAPAVVKPVVPAGEPIVRKPFPEADITKLTDAAAKAASVAEFLKSDLVTTALAEKQTSRATLDRWFAEFEQPADWQGDAVKTARFKAMARAEADLIGRRLLGRAAVFAEIPAQLAEAQAQGNAAANALADARARALDALRLNMNNPNPVLGAEVALAGRPVANTNASWVFRDGAFYSTGVGTIGRECNLPTKARIEFELAWKGQPNIRFSFFTRSTDHYDYNDGWQFYTSSSGYIYSMRRSGMGATTSMSARVPQMLAKNSVRLTFLVNTETETTVLLADGERVHEWKNLGSPGNGTGIVFHTFNSNSRIRLSDIRIAPWDGRERVAEPLGAPGDDPDKLVVVPPADSAVVEFANRDRATGTLHGIRDGKLTFDPAGTKLEIPLTRAALIAFPVNAAPALPKGEGVQVTLHRNERLTLALEKWEAGEIIAVSPVFGRLKLKPESVRGLRFNPSAPRGPVDEWGGL